MRLELYVRFADGSGKVVQTEEDTPANRRRLDKAAFAILGRGARWAKATPVERTANTRGRGSYR